MLKVCWSTADNVSMTLQLAVVVLASMGRFSLWGAVLVDALTAIAVIFNGLCVASEVEDASGSGSGGGGGKQCCQKQFCGGHGADNSNSQGHSHEADCRSEAVSHIGGCCAGNTPANNTSSSSCGSGSRPQPMHTQCCVRQS